MQNRSRPPQQSSREFQRRVRPLWERYLESGEATELNELILDSIVRDCGHAHPWRHRICDVILDEVAYRVGRCVPCNEELTFTPIDRALEEPGVPYALTGADLRSWVEAESARPSRDAIDWTALLRSPPQSRDRP
jgi:hypothetical protein